MPTSVAKAYAMLSLCPVNAERSSKFSVMDTTGNRGELILRPPSTDSIVGWTQSGC